MLELAPLVAISDTEQAATALNNGAVVVYLGDPLNKPVQLNNALNATELVPDYSLLQILIDGNIILFEKEYYESLKFKRSSFTSIFRFMYMKKTVMLFFPPDIIELRYPEILLRFFRTYYGVQAATKSTDFCFDSCNCKIQIDLLTDNIISVEEFIMNSEFIDDLGINILHSYWDYDFPEFRKMSGQAAVNFIEKKKEEIKTYGYIIRPTKLAPAFTKQQSGIIIP